MDEAEKLLLKFADGYFYRTHGLYHLSKWFDPTNGTEPDVTLSHDQNVAFNTLDSKGYIGMVMRHYVPAGYVITQEGLIMAAHIRKKRGAEPE